MDDEELQKDIVHTKHKRKTREIKKKKTESSSDDESSVEEEPRRSKRLKKSVAVAPRDEDTSEDEDYSDYFEADTTQLQDTIVEHVLDTFTLDQQRALRKKVRKGVDSAFTTMQDLVTENFGSLIGASPTTNMWKLGMGPQEIKQYSKMLKALRATNLKDKVTIQRVLGANLDMEQKRQLLSLFDMLQTMDPYSSDYLSLSKQINMIIEASKHSLFTPQQLEQFVKKEIELKKIIGQDLPIKVRILSADMDDQRKAAIYEKFLLLQKTPDDSVTAASLEEWIEEALKTPYTKIKPNLLDAEKPGECLVKLKQAFQEKLSDMDAVLEPLLTVFNNRMHNPDGTSLVIGLLGSPGVGKCLGKNTPILMYDGSIKMVQDVQQGDLLMGDDSTARNVLSVTTGGEMMYTVKQGYGDDYRVNESHILSLKLTESARMRHSIRTRSFIIEWCDRDGLQLQAFRYQDQDFDQVRNAAQAFCDDKPRCGDVIDIPLRDYIAKPTIWKWLKGYKVAIEYTEQEVHVDPYQFGCRLPHLELEGIPQNYLINSQAVRKNLLAGLIDTIGHKSNDSYHVLTLQNIQLANDVLTLSRSLGYRTTLLDAGNFCSLIDCYRLFVYSAGDLPLRVTPAVTHIDEKALSYDIQVIPDRPDDYYGFQIDGNRRFVLGDYTVTHNTAVGKVIADVWGLPFQQISLGGLVDSTILDGQHPGWVGSAPGRFAKALQDMGVINGVLFLDEIDKLGKTQEGLQVQYSLLHSTDPIQQGKFNDHYLGPKLPINLAKSLFICALNTLEGLDPALLNRMHIIKVPDYAALQKSRITVKHLFPEALTNAGLSSEDIVLPPETCEVIQSTVEGHVGKEGGVRGVKACIRMIVDKLSLLIHTSAEEQQQLQLSFKADVSRRPVVITPAIVAELYKPGDQDNAWKHMYN